MKEEGLLYDIQSGGFFHVCHERGKLKIDKQPCRHQHSARVIISAE